MAKLRTRETQTLEDYLDMGTGWVLNFNDRTFKRFFNDFGLDIELPKYSEGNSGSKANRLRRFWEFEPDGIVGEVIEELILYAEDYRPGNAKTEACRQIALRLSREQQRASQAPQVKIDRFGAQQTHAQISVDGPVEIFFSYAHEDEDLMNAVRQQLIVHEKNGRITKWHDRMIPAGDEWRSQIDERIRRADVILLFMSPSFIESQYCYEIEGKVALEKHSRRSARVIPIVLRACEWTATPFGEMQALPTDGIPLNQAADLDQVSLDVARGIMMTIGTDQ